MGPFGKYYKSSWDSAQKAILNIQTSQDCWGLSGMNVGLTGCEARYRGPLLSIQLVLGQPLTPGLTGPASCPPRFPPKTESLSLDKVHRGWTVVTLSGYPRHSDCMLCPPCHVGHAPGVAAPPCPVPPAFQLAPPIAFPKKLGFKGAVMQPAKDLGGCLVPQWTSGTYPDHLKDSWLAWGLPHPP